MARDTQTPLDKEIERAARDAEPQVEEFEDELQSPDDAQDALEAIEAEADADNIVEADSEALTARVEELEQRLAETRDQALRAAAETQNVRRRSEQEVDKARKFALEKFVKELLPVVDSLEKALEAMQEEASDAHREGVSMTLKMQLDALKKFGVEVVDPQGEPFDPQYHEAMAMVPNPELDPNTVMEVIQKGYLLNDRLVRPAMVVVSQAAK
ncbi:nucleotide exchange factor GrpE [Pistricoccus aurantiacus]|uniref:nucleotide exchange factor GrpE n=1 Tax=Pistricoccus aurantiacus TaxID=1883414 RepID=UPI0036443BCA